MTPILEAELAVPAQCELAEGPVWDVRRGLLWRVDILAGTMAWDETGNPPGSLYRLSRLFYYADSNSGRVDLFDTDPDTGALSARRSPVTIPAAEGVPDGLTLDAEGSPSGAPASSAATPPPASSTRWSAYPPARSPPPPSAARPRHPLHHLRRGGPHPRRTGRATPRRRHLRLHPGVTGRPPFLFGV